MNILFTATSIVFFIWIVRNVFFWISLWQTKEYRLDRMTVHLLETVQGRRLFISFDSFLKWAAILMYGLVIRKSPLLAPYEFFVFSVYLFQTVRVLREVTVHTLKRPVFTSKSVLIAFLTLLIIYGLFRISLVDSFLWFLILDRIAFAIIGFLIFLLTFPTELYRDFKIKQAIKKIEEHKKLIVIGITGSYGKSSTKEFVAQILAKKFRVVYTPGTNNTPIGVANTIIKSLKKDTQILVIEMGAYKKGEISQICQIIKPKIGILTGINEQHLSLFGSLVNTMDTKYELIDSLPKTGLAFFNANNEYTFKLSHRTTNELKKTRVLYGSLESFSSLHPFDKDVSHIVASNVVAGKTFVTFDASLYSLFPRYKKTISNIRSSVIGTHNIENILPGIYIADYLGMTSHEIRNALLSLSSLVKKMSVNKSKRGSIFIDDSHNSNPAGVLAILKFIKSYKIESYYKTTKKIFVLQPLIELGKNADEVHYRISQEIGRVCDVLFLTNNNFYNAIARGIEDSGGTCAIAVLSPLEIVEYMKKNLDKEDIVVFEGRESGLAINISLKTGL